MAELTFDCASVTVAAATGCTLIFLVLQLRPLLTKTSQLRPKLVVEPFDSDAFVSAACAAHGAKVLANLALFVEHVVVAVDKAAVLAERAAAAYEAILFKPSGPTASYAIHRWAVRNLRYIEDEALHFVTSAPFFRVPLPAAPRLIPLV